MLYFNDDIEKLNNLLPIEKIVGEFVELKRSGANYKGLCPFHNDTSPSFIVSPSKNICKCFVCGAGGNPVSFYANYKKLSTDEAIKELATKYNIPIREKNFNNQDTEEKLIYFEIMDATNKFYQERIFKNSGKMALEYLVGRGITPEDIMNNGLGYSPNERNALGEYLLGKGYPLEKIIDVGLVKEGDNGIFDVFRNRVMFPIHSINRKVVAFGGRTLEKEKDVAKYINSPDTPIFKKGNMLYGLGEKSNKIKSKNYAILMEGYMDVLMVTLNGFDVSLAPLGTALTEEQGKLLKRYTNNVIIAFDMDAPGQKATERAILTLKELGFSIRILQFEGSKDPDEYLKKNGKDAFLEVIKSSLESFDFLYNLYSKEYDLNDILSKQNFIRRFKDFFQIVKDKVEQSLYIDKLSVNIGVAKELLWESLVEENKSTVRKKRIDWNEKVEEFTQNTTVVKCQIEYLAASLLLSNNSYYKYFKNKRIKTPLISKIFNFYHENREAGEINFLFLAKNEEFTELEKDEILDFSRQSLSRGGEEELLKDILGEWLRAEIKECEAQNKEQNKNPFIMLELKKEELKLSEKCSLSKLEEIENRIENIKKNLYTSNRGI